MGKIAIICFNLYMRKIGAYASGCVYFLLMQHALYRVAFSCCIMRFLIVFLRFIVATPRYVHNR